MKKIFFIIITSFFFLLTLDAEEQLYSVQGHIYYQNQGKIYIMMVNKEFYQANKNKSTPYQRSIEIRPEQRNNKSVHFEISNIPHGRYCLVVFQDTNNNGQLDKNIFGPTEPWCMYNMKQGAAGKPQFNDIAFFVDRDISNIQIKLR